MNETNKSFNVEYFIGLKWSAYMGPIISLLGILTNFINICIFLNPKLDETSYRYMLSNSITNLLYLVFIFMATFFVGCLNCLSSQTYFAEFYRIFINDYFTSCLAIFRILIDITLSVRTLRVLKNKKWLENISYKWILIFWFLFSLIFYVPVAFAYAIYSMMSQSPIYGSIQLFYADVNDFGNSLAYVVISNIETSVRLFLAVVVLSTVNVLNVIEFRRRFCHGVFKNQTKKTTDNSQNNARSKAAKHIMVISVSFLNAIGTIPFAITFILLKFAFTYDEIIDYYNTALCLLLLTYASDIFTYYYFNKLYRNVLKGFIKKAFSLF